MDQRFTALQDFECEELKSHYAKGLSYTCRAGAKYDTLRGLLPTWVKDGKVELGGTPSQLSGAGETK